MWQNKIRDITTIIITCHHMITQFFSLVKRRRESTREKFVLSYFCIFFCFLFIFPASLYLSSLHFPAVFLLRVLLGVPCFVAGTRDSRVNSYRAQRVSLRGLTLTHLRILLRISPYISLPATSMIRTHTHTHVYALPLSQSVFNTRARVYNRFLCFTSFI